jgi:hypothetical protein
MPVLDGIAAAERIAAQRIAPVVILSAFSQRELVERAREAGAMAYLVKPFTQSDLVPAVEMALSRFAELTQLESEVADLTETPAGAYNFRVNSQLAGRHTTDNIDIMNKEGVSGIDIFIKPNTKNESVHIPVVVSASGLKETVYNDFFIGDNCDVVIVAGCGIDNCGEHDAQHDGVHRFYVGKNSKVKYVEKHYGSGDGSGKRILNPVTEVYMEDGSSMEMEMEQIKGVDSTERSTIAELKSGAKLAGGVSRSSGSSSRICCVV